MEAKTIGTGGAIFIDPSPQGQMFFSQDGSIYKNMAAVMTEIDSIAKGRKNKEQGYDFRGIDEVYNELHGILAKNHVVTLPEVISEEAYERISKSGSALLYRRYTIRYWFVSDDGSRCTCVVKGEAMDTGDKASNKAMAVAHKYALLQTFCIPTRESQVSDADLTTPPETLPKKANELPAYTGKSNEKLPPAGSPAEKTPADKPPEKAVLSAEDSFNYLSHFVTDIANATGRDQMMKVYHKYFTEAKAVMTDTDTTQAKAAYKQKFDTFKKEPTKKGEK